MRLGQTLALEVSSTGADHCPGKYSSVSAATKKYSLSLNFILLITVGS
jgi:hypothetical protein